MIKTINLGYQYSKKVQIFNNLNLTFSPGKIYGLLGKNGAGKSTLIKNITGMLFPTKGISEVFGLVPKNREVSFLKELFFVPEEYYLPNLTINELVTIYKDFYPNFDTNQFNNYTKEFKIEKSKKTTELSLGQKKKILIGFALSANTKVLIMDEPTNGLDIPSKILFRNMINDSFKKDRIVIITSHQVRDLDELIHSIIIMNDGEILLNNDKDFIAKNLHFQLTDTLQDTIDLIYQEKVSNGFASIKKNNTNNAGYIDIELLFNAVLTDESKINALLN
ncbi:ABC-2 type transport system ATP-binding protein [Lutibacter sp. Hel_I_33_5]|uniref:ABC transporter ATP-binding protein n=1 Tax=Lutibacter sp. Hel_I_33_5 TaxID=1566289 RepID=UPI0011A2E18D|nr:ABC transporter ATP-binding protein [Lutibacter sp. Hel_I_33_5]TVZ55005.1 ABC-2 type transport system ATP-binding protein [Lutibacter sp. Hel_I_33_5]